MAYPFEQDDTDDIELFPHTPGHFCPDMNCPDKEDQEATTQLGSWVNEGLMTVDEANNFYRGGNI
jgi:hypothetical protein